MASSGAIWSPPMGEMDVFMAEGMGGLMTDGMFELMAEEIGVLNSMKQWVYSWQSERMI